MPIHDRTRVRAGTFHDFRQSWLVRITDAPNTGPLPPGYHAMADQEVFGPDLPRRGPAVLLRDRHSLLPAGVPPRAGRSSRPRPARRAPTWGAGGGPRVVSG